MYLTEAVENQRGAKICGALPCDGGVEVPEEVGVRQGEPRLRGQAKPRPTILSTPLQKTTNPCALCLSRPAQPTLTPLHLQRVTLGPLVGSLRRAQRSPLSIGANGIYQYTQYIRDGSSTINTKPLPDGDFEDLIYMSGSRRAFKASSLRQLQMQSSWGSEAVD